MVTSSDRSIGGRERSRAMVGEGERTDRPRSKDRIIFPPFLLQDRIIFPPFLLQDRKYLVDSIYYPPLVVRSYRTMMSEINERYWASYSSSICVQLRPQYSYSIIEN